MNTITYAFLTENNFNENSLDDFLRHQVVTERWRKNSDNEYVLMPEDYVYEWDLNQRQEVARKILKVLKENGFAYGALCEEKVIGYIVVSNEIFGSNNQYTNLPLFHISEPYRGCGIGKKLFHLACETAKKNGAQKLYISANSSKESQAAYRKMGCIDAMEINQAKAEAEPEDVQMEYIL